MFFLFVTWNKLRFGVHLLSWEAYCVLVWLFADISLASPETQQFIFLTRVRQSDDLTLLCAVSSVLMNSCFYSFVSVFFFNKIFYVCVCVSILFVKSRFIFLTHIFSTLLLMDVFVLFYTPVLRLIFSMIQYGTLFFYLPTYVYNTSSFSVREELLSANSSGDLALYFWMF